MIPTKLLVGQILIVFAIVFLGLWASIQWAASMLAYQPELGAPWFLLGELPVYRPWALFPWRYHFEAYAPQVFDKAGTLAGASGFLGCGAAVGGSLVPICPAASDRGFLGCFWDGCYIVSESDVRPLKKLVTPTGLEPVFSP